MKIGRRRCRGASVLDDHRIQWFSEHKLNKNKVGKFWGTCIACGGRHYDDSPCYKPSMWDKFK